MAQKPKKEVEKKTWPKTIFGPLYLEQRLTPSSAIYCEGKPRSGSIRYFGIRKIQGQELQELSKDRAKMIAKNARTALMKIARAMKRDQAHRPPVADLYDDLTVKEALMWDE